MKQDKIISKLLVEFGLPPDYPEKRGLIPYKEAKDMIEIGINPYGSPVFLSPEAGKAWNRMLVSATEDNVVIYPLSGYRSVAVQADIIRNKLNQGLAIHDIMKANAPPGYSQHHTGNAIDICTDTVTTADLAFEKSNAFKWLIIYAPLYGFILPYPRDNTYGFLYEPWHWYFNLKM